MDGSLNGETWRFIVRNIRIGVVEDDPASCQLVLDYLNRYQSETGEQFTVSVFDDGARIVEKYSPVYDILLLDIEMKEMDGMEAARRIRERDDKVVIIFITAAPQYAISGYEVRALSYLLKPLPWFAFSQELKKSIDMVRRNDDDSMLIDTGRGQMRYVALEVPLTLFGFRWFRKCGDSGTSGIEMLGKALDGSAFAGCITSFKNNDKFFAFLLNP